MGNEKAKEALALAICITTMLISLMILPATAELSTRGIYCVQVKWNYTASANISWLDSWEDGFATGDLNDDGIPDVVFGTKDGYVIAVNGINGTPLWTFKIPNTAEYVHADIVDIDGDGINDVVAGGKASTGNAQIVALSKEGVIKWNATGDYKEVTDFAYGDIDNDGDMDVVASIGTYPWSGGQVILIDGSTGSRIWTRNLGSGHTQGIDARDIDGDGDMEVAVTNYNNKVFLIDGSTGNIIWSRTGKWYGRDVIIADIDDDGALEIIAGLSNPYCYDAKGNLKWSFDFGEHFKASDVNDDGKTELIATCPWRGITYVVDGHTGKEVWNRKEAGAADVGDVNGDGIDDIATGTASGWYDYPINYIDAIDGSNTTLWKYEVEKEPSSVIVANIDDDIEGEVLVAIGNKLIALDTLIPRITVETDKFKYCPCDTMNITIDISNPMSEAVIFKWFLWIPQLDYSTMIYKKILPAGYEDTIEVPLHVEKWGEKPFSLVWYVDLQDAKTGHVLAADTTVCAYCPTCGRKAITVPVLMPSDIATEIREETEGII